MIWMVFLFVNYADGSFKEFADVAPFATYDDCVAGAARFLANVSWDVEDRYYECRAVENEQT